MIGCEETTIRKMKNCNSTKKIIINYDRKLKIVSLEREKKLSILYYLHIQ